MVQDGCVEHKVAMSPQEGKMKVGPWERKPLLPSVSPITHIFSIVFFNGGHHHLGLRKPNHECMKRWVKESLLI
jgi:hypothetical protein